MSSSQQLSPRRETGRGLFQSDFLNRTAAAFGTQHLPMSAPCRKTRLQARRRPNLRDETARVITRELKMTAYLISLALTGLVAIALWEAMS
jgi:hypothetical protein